MYPSRRFAFQPLHDLAWGELRLRHYQNVYMILDAANLNGDDLMISRDPADVCPNAFFNVTVDQVLPTFGRKDDVVEEIGIGIRHTFLTA